MGRNILAVDDIKANRDLIKSTLEALFYNVATAEDGPNALKYVEENSVDLIVLDVMMPRMSGYEVCSTLKQDIKTLHIPVIMLTALSETDDRVQGLECGADDFLTKPMNTEHLVTRVKSLIQIKEMVDQWSSAVQMQSGMDDITRHQLQEKIDDTQGAEILIINDDVVLNQNIQNSISEIYSITMCDDVEELCKYTGDGKYSTIVVSTQLEDISGLKICSDLRSNDITKDIPLIVLIYDGDQSCLKQAFDMGIHDYIMVPFDDNELKARIKTQVKRRRFQLALQDIVHNKMEMAVMDKLTQCHNRGYFDNHFNQSIEGAMESGMPLSVLIMDLDNFKSVNDTHGHLAGDELLIQIAERIKDNVRESDLVSRYGGEEFSVTLLNTDSVTANAVAERIRSCIEKEPFRMNIDGERLVLNKTISIGGAILRKDDTQESFLNRADGNLYKAKTTGKNKVVMEE